MKFARHAGVSLIEVLTAVLVLSLAAVGAAGMHLKALRATHESGLQSAALQVAVEAAERMRLHHARQLRAGGGSETPFIGQYQGVAPSSPAEPARSCHGEACDPARLAAFDTSELAQLLRAALPGGRMVVCRDARPWDAEQDALRWGCDGDGNASVVVKVGWRERDPLDGTVAAGAESPPAVVLVAHP